MKAVKSRSIHLSNKTESELRQMAETTTKTVISKMRKMPRMQELIDEISETFKYYIRHEPNSKRVEAKMFEHLKEKYSPPQITKARIILGIRSVCGSGKNWRTWYWSIPTANPETALENWQANNSRSKVVKNDAQKHLDRVSGGAAKALQHVMEQLNLYAENKVVRKEIEARGYSRNTTNQYKSILKISSYNENGKRVWVWGNRDVQDWIENLLSKGPKREDEIFELSKWRKLVLADARDRMGTVIREHKNGEWWWKDINCKIDIKASEDNEDWWKELSNKRKKKAKIEESAIIEDDEDIEELV